MSNLVARLKAADPTVGLKTLTYSVFGVHFTHELGWVRVTSEIAAKLKKMRQNDNAKEPRIFEVMTADEAKKLDDASFSAKYRAKGASADRPLAVAAVSLDDDEPEEDEPEPTEDDEDDDDEEGDDEDDDDDMPPPPPAKPVAKKTTAAKTAAPAAKPTLPGAPTK